MSTDPFSPASGRAEFWVWGALAALGAAGPVIGFYFSRAAVGLVAVPAVLAVVVLFQPVAREVRREILDALKNSSRLAPVLVLGALFAWAAASATWSLEPLTALGAALRSVALVVFGLVGIAVARRLPGAARNNVGFWLTAGVVAALAALATEYYSDGLLGRLLYKMETPLLDRHRFNRGVTIVALMSLPALLWLWQGGRRVASLALALAAFWLFKHMDSLATTYGFLGACLLFLLARRWPRAVAWGLAGALVLAVVALPLLASHLEPLIGLDVPPSRWSPIYEKMRTRFLIWNFVWQRIGEQPWLGWGMDASRYVPGGAETLPDRPTNVLPLHPHNGLLQLWLELGIVGYLAGTGAALLAVRRLIGTGWPEDAQAAGLALVAYIGLFAMVSYGLWQSWWLAAVGLAATFLAAVTPVSAERGNSGPA